MKGEVETALPNFPVAFGAENREYLLQRLTIVPPVVFITPRLLFHNFSISRDFVVG
jgi:hypothetical protein